MGLAIVTLELTSLKLYYGDYDTATELNVGHNPVLARGTMSFRWLGQDMPVPSMDSNFISRGEKQHLMTNSLEIAIHCVRVFFQVMIQFHAWIKKAT
ncbi:hypothetical protein OROMI_027446 [Orobanche minor]